MLLAIDTSTSFASIALINDDETLVEHTWRVGRRQSTELLAQLDLLLAAPETRPDRLTGVAVATGPGSFTGLRVALATAKSLAFALDIPLYGRSTLDIQAWGYHHAQGTVCAVIEAGRGQFYTAQYAAPASAPAGWGPRDDVAVLTAAELAERTPEPTLICGKWSASAGLALAEAFGARATFASPLAGRRAIWLAELTAASAPVAAEALEPLYARRPNITTSARKGLAARAPAAADLNTSTLHEEQSHALRR